MTIQIRALLIATVMLVAAPVWGQVPQPAPFTGATVQIYAPGVDPVSGTPTQTVPTTNFTCNVAGPIPPGPTPLVNPTTIYFSDQVNVGRFCTATISTSLPTASGYVATVTGIWSGGVTGRSAASNPFNIQAIQVPPGVPTGLQVR